MSGALHNTSKTNISRRRHQKLDKNAKLMPPPSRAIQPQHQNWLARFLRIRPAVSIVCFRISKIRARKEIGNVLREWRKYGMKDIVVDKAAGRIWARVGEKNCKLAGLLVFLFFCFSYFTKSLFYSYPWVLVFSIMLSLHHFTHPVPQQHKFRSDISTALNIKPVSLAIELFTVLHHGRKANLSIARFTQEKGAKSSFERVLEALESVLLAREFLIVDQARKEEMTRVLGGGG